MTDPLDPLLRRGLRDQPSTNVRGQCLDAETAAAFLENTLEAAERARAEAHLAECGRCQAVTSALIRATPAVAARPWWRRPAVGWLAPLTAAAVALLVWVNVSRQPAAVPPAPSSPQRTPAPPAPEPARQAPEPAPPQAPPPRTLATADGGTAPRPAAKEERDANATEREAGSPAFRVGASAGAPVVAEPAPLALTRHAALADNTKAAASDVAAPETVIVRSGALALRALVWRPAGDGPFPAVLFNHGSHSTNDPMSPTEAEILGRIFAGHGYVFLFVFRQGIGLSAGQGVADGDQMQRALAAGGQDARNRVQLELLEGEEMNEARAALAALQSRADVDARRIAMAGHSFGGSLSLLLAERDPSIRAVVSFGGAAGNWPVSPPLRQRLLDAMRTIDAPVLLVHAANDYSTAPGEALAAELRRLGKPHQLKIYPAFGRTPRDGHNLHFLSPRVWEQDVFAFLDAAVTR